MTEEQREIYRMLMWDYDIPPEEVHKLLQGETDRAGHYDIKRLFIKMLNNLTWYDILKIMPISKITELLTPDIISKIRFKSILSKYERLQKILRREPLPPAKQYFDALGKNPYIILSHRRYST